MTTLAVGLPVFDHLNRLTGRHGLFEHALHDQPRPEHGHCVDDAARALVVTCREPAPGRTVRRLAQRYLDFTVSALDADGRCHNRMDGDGQWTDEAALGDWWGRAVWGLGAAAAGAATAAMRSTALRAFHVAATQRSPHLRAMVFAALGAGEVLLADPADPAARSLLLAAVDRVGPQADDRTWPWPEPRLSYANGAVAEALLIAGQALPSDSALEHGLVLADFLQRTETEDGRLSVTPAGGRGPADTRPGFDQQPIEVAALADAFARAYAVTGDARWRAGVDSAWAWFLGDNDARTPMADARTGAGFDGLHRAGRNENRGAESTLAALATAQQARRARAHHGPARAR